MFNAQMFKAKHYLSCAEKEFNFWYEKETELKEKYGVDPTIPEINHIKAIKEYKKKAKSDLLYWQNELSKLEQKEAVHQLFQ